MHGRQTKVVTFFLVWVLLLCPALAWAHPHARDAEAALSTGDDTEEQLAAIAVHLKTEEFQDAQCELGSEMGRIAWEIRAALPRAKDETIKRVAGLIIGPTREGAAKCLTKWAANVLGMIGPRAEFAVPALEKALAEAEAAEARREKTPWDGLNMDERLDTTIRTALKAIDGKQR